MTTEQAKKKPVKRKNVQEKFMLMLTLIFVLGVVVLTITPEGNGYRGIAMTTYTCLVTFVIFKWGL